MMRREYLAPLLAVLLAGCPSDPGDGGGFASGVPQENDDDFGSQDDDDIIDDDDVSDDDDTTGPVSLPEYGKATLWISGESENGLLGFVVSSAGDFDGDGLADLAVTESGWRSSASELLARVHVFRGSTLAGASGELDLDQAHAVLIGPVANAEADRSGKVYLFRSRLLVGGGTFDLSTADVEIRGEQAVDVAGPSAGLGDIDGDGIGDILIGALGASDVGEQGGKACLFSGADLDPLTVRWLSSADTTIFGDEAWDWMGLSVRAAGDVDGDSRPDALVLSRVSTIALDPPYRAGEVYLFSGTTLAAGGDLDPDDADVTLYGGGDDEFDYFGAGLSGGGDVDGDGRADILVSSTRWGDGDAELGAVYLFTAAGLDGRADADRSDADRSDADTTFLGEQPDDRAGWSAAFVGDVDGDGRTDLAWGAPYYDSDLDDSGRVYLYLGP